MEKRENPISFRPTGDTKETLKKLVVKCKCSRNHLINLAIQAYKK